MNEKVLEAKENCPMGAIAIEEEQKRTSDLNLKFFYFLE